MRTKLLMMSTAALLAGTLAAASQSIQPGGSAQEKGASSGQGQMSQGQPSKEQSGKELPGKPAPNRNAQSSQGTRDQAQGKEPSTSNPAKGKEPPTTNGQATGGRDEDRARGNVQGNQDKKPQGQTQRDQDRNQSQSQREQDRQRPGQTEGQAPRDQNRQQQGQTQREQDPQRPGQTEGQAPRGQDQDRSQQGEREGQGNVSISFTPEQRTKIRETVSKEKNAPRVSKVDFSLNVGTPVPRTVHVIDIPQVIVDIHPEWRGYRYFIVNEELVVVDPDTLRIIAVIDV